MTQPVLTYDDFVERLDAFCEQENLSPATVCVRAVGNSRFLPRSEKKLKEIDENCQKILAYMDGYTSDKPEQPREAAH